MPVGILTIPGGPESSLPVIFVMDGITILFLSCCKYLPDASKILIFSKFTGNSNPPTFAHSNHIPIIGSSKKLFSLPRPNTARIQLRQGLYIGAASDHPMAASIQKTLMQL
jgi:hypothetical protein